MSYFFLPFQVISLHLTSSWLHPEATVFLEALSSGGSLFSHHLYPRIPCHLCLTPSPLQTAPLAPAHINTLYFMVGIDATKWNLHFHTIHSTTYLYSYTFHLLVYYKVNLSTYTLDASCLYKDLVLPVFSSIDFSFYCIIPMGKHGFTSFPLK